MRVDGYKVKSAEPMYALIPYFLTKRYDAMNMITIDIPVEPLKQFINQKRKEGIMISHLGLVIAAYVRMLGEFPFLNRFIGNKTVYQHKDFTVSMVVLRPRENSDIMSKIHFELDDDVFMIQKRIDDYVESKREGEDTSLDKAMNILQHIPGLMGAAIGVLRFLDKHGLLPKALVETSPFHASLLISNLASIRTNHIYHHLYQFGTTSIGITMGNLRERPKRGRDGEIIHEKCIPLGVVMDERICGGHYFADAFGKFQKYLAHPELLEKAPDFKIPTAKEAASIV